MNPTQTVPEGTEPISAEGKDLALAIAAAAETIGVSPNRVEFKFDLAHFRSSTGAPVAKRTVKILAWNTTKSDDELAAEAKAKPAPKPRRDDGERRGRDDGERRGRGDRDRGDRGRGDRDERRGRGRERGGDRGDRGGRDDRRSRGRDRGERRSKEERAPRPAPGDLEDTEASTFAREWFVELMKKMDIEGEVKSGGTEDRVQLWINAERAGRLIGKRGSTLGAIRHLLGLMVHKRFGELTIDVDVEDNRPKNDRKRERGGDRSNRGDRDDRRGGRERDRSNEKRYPEEKLKALARRASEKAIETGKTITINLELNSYDRRLVHLEVAEVEGVVSRSEVRDDGMKIIQVVPEAE